MSYEKFGTNDLIIQVYSEQPQSNFGPHRIPRGIRVIHIPTGTVVSCDADRSQHRNRHLALTKLWNEVQSKPSYQELKLQLDNALAQNAELVAQVEALRIAALNAIQRMPGGEAKADLRDAYDATPTKHLRDRDAEVVLSAVEFFKPARDVDVEALESYAEKVRRGEV